MEINGLDSGEKERDLFYNTKPYLNPGFGIYNRFGMGKIKRDILFNRYHDDKSVLREINKLNYKKNNLDFFEKTKFYKSTGFEKNGFDMGKKESDLFFNGCHKKSELREINRLGIGKKKLDVYYSTKPNIGAGIVYDINDDWSVYGGVGYSGSKTEIKNPEKYSPEVGIIYSPKEPKCSIF